jgi:hypothetical protein
VDPKRNPDYLRTVIQAVEEFRDSFLRFMELHVPNTSLARGIAPAVFPRNGADKDEIDKARVATDRAAGRASAAPGLTNAYIAVQGLGVVDPLAVWSAITDPKPPLEPQNILSAADTMIGRLEQMVAEAEALAPPKVGVETLHPLIWGAAAALWRDGHRRLAVAAACEALIGQVKARLGRYDVPDTALWQQAFSTSAPEPGKPRLRWPGSPEDMTVKAMNDGLRLFAPGVQLLVRNQAVHSTDEIGDQDALERLAALSLLARLVQDCELLPHEPA